MYTAAQSGHHPSSYFTLLKMVFMKPRCKWELHFKIRKEKRENIKICSRKSHLFANCTKPHPLPTGILTETISPNGIKDSLSISSVTSESSPPTKI